jgi:hypothetical protein
MSGPEQPYQPPEYPASQPWQQPTQYSAPPAYPPPPAYPAPADPYGQYAQPEKTNGFSIASLVLGILGFLCITALLGLIFGFIGLSQTKGGREKGRGMAIAGLVCSGVWIVAIVAVVTLVAIFDKSVPATAVKVGDCIETTPPDNAKIDTLPKVACSKPHEAEVYALLPVSGDSFPGQAAMERDYKDRCETALSAYSPKAAADSSVRMYVIFPSQETWDRGHRDVACMAITDDKRTGSLKD